MIIKTLNEVDLEDLLEGFKDAFSDYVADISMTKELFMRTLKCRRVDKDYSLIALENDKVVGFIINGSGFFKDEYTIYDIFTGVSKKNRGRGITKTLFEKLELLLKESLFKQYLLEVIDNNFKAINLYRKKGFIKNRNLSIFSFKDFNIRDFKEDIIIKEYEYFYKDDYKKMTFYLPSWQNSFETLEEIKNEVKVLEAYFKDELVGYLTFRENEIYSFGSIKNYKVDILNQLFKNFHEKCKLKNIEGKLLNVDSENDIIEYLFNIGFRKIKDRNSIVEIGQLEMIKKL
ncbi:GNAT family N-acetyltransferase [Oceanotoga sp. DSM 15011]|jgi:ribosomal protein S18 acetylase RimI-like enzyme|uniref:GNAT family N-acetyltransferase n=1 Tax=Oceanotoga sp. DSM 15011 TaxID=2984951 RepID=UPI0021F48521|nr:GNAT family N-acetyltransferase [Oceanotoga sp. DSM 15011]UYP00195.1 GNAT family N-acetyltransferase [Oceanotoga sp. DSM 15011]